MATFASGAGAGTMTQVHEGTGTMTQVQDGVTTILDPTVLHPTTLTFAQAQTSHACEAGKLCMGAISANELHIIKNRE